MAPPVEILLRPLRNLYRRGHFVPENKNAFLDIDVTSQTMTTLGAIHKEDYDTILFQFIIGSGADVNFEIFGSALDDDSHGDDMPHDPPPDENSNEWLLLPEGMFTVPLSTSVGRLVNDRYTWIMVKYHLVNASPDSSFTVRIRAD